MNTDKALTIKRINDLIHNYILLKSQDLTRVFDFGEELSFKSISTEINEIKNILEKIQSIELELIPYKSLALLEKDFRKYEELSKRIMELNPRSNDLQSIRNSIINDFEQLHNDIFIDTQGILTLLNTKTLFDEVANPIERRIEDAQRVYNELLEDIKEKRIDIIETQKSINTIYQNVQNISIDLVISKHQEIFNTLADEYKESKKNWLKSSAVFASFSLIIICFSIISIFIFPQLYNNLSTSISIQLTSSKILLISLLIFATIWCGKIYKSHFHNEIINRHRAKALSTYQAFVDGADKEIKNSILIKTTDAIFSHQNTGFNNSENDKVAGNPNIYEIIKSVISDSK